MAAGVGTLGIMVERMGERKSILKKYESCNKTSIKLFSFTPSDIDWDHKQICGLAFTNGAWREKKFLFPKAVYNRCYNQDASVVQRIEEVIGSKKCFNHINQLNKLDSYCKLNRWLGSHLPRTAPYSKEALLDLMRAHKQIYVKPIYGNNGKGVYRVKKMDTGEIHISTHHFMPSLIVSGMDEFQQEIDRLFGSAPYLIQQGISTLQLNQRNFDLRVLAQKNMTGQWSVTNVVSRIAYEGCFNTSICEEIVLSDNLLGKFFSKTVMKEKLNTIYNISLRAAEIIELDTSNHLCEISVDIVLDANGGIWIIEVNGKPQKSIYRALNKKSKTVYSKPLDYARFVAKR